MDEIALDDICRYETWPLFILVGNGKFIDKGQSSRLLLSIKNAEESRLIPMLSSDLLDAVHSYDSF